MKIILKILCVVMIAGAIAVPGYAADKTIKMGTMSWADLMPITGITQHVLEDLGYNVEVTDFANWGIAYAALRSGDIEILASQINYAAQPYWDRYKGRLEKISAVSFGLYQAIAVPTYVDIDSMKQLNAHAEQFDGKIIGIEPGSGLMKDTQQAIKAYDLDFRLVGGSTPGMTAALKSAIARKDWIAVTLWSPSWMMQKFDVKFLKDPKGVFAPPQAYYWVGHEGFSEKHPQVRNIIAGIYVPREAIISIGAAVENGKSMGEAINNWLENHQSRLKRWKNVETQ